MVNDSPSPESKQNKGSKFSGPTLPNKNHNVSFIAHQISK